MRLPMPAEAPGIGLELAEASKRFAASTVLDGVSLRLPAAGALLLAGGNGAGKSTLLRLLAGLARPSAGQVRVGGQEPHRSALVRQRIGLLAHGSLLYDELDAAENLLFVARLYRLDRQRERVERSLKENDLMHRQGQRVGTYSRGMKQRLSLARATLHDPGLLLLDEPYTGLDRRSAERLGERLARLRQQGTTTVLVTHRLEEAAGHIDHIALLRRGRLCHSGPFTGNLQDLRSLYEERLGEGSTA